MRVKLHEVRQTRFAATSVGHFSQEIIYMIAYIELQKKDLCMDLNNCTCKNVIEIPSGRRGGEGGWG